MINSVKVSRTRADLRCRGNGRFPDTANPAAIAYFLAAMAWSTLW